MRVMLTTKGETCKHTQLGCLECGSVAFKEKPGPKPTKWIRFKRLARRARETFTREELKQRGYEE